MDKLLFSHRLEYYIAMRINELQLNVGVAESRRETMKSYTYHTKKNIFVWERDMKGGDKNTEEFQVDNSVYLNFIPIVMISNVKQVWQWGKTT